MNFDIARATHYERNLGQNSQKNRYLAGGIIMLFGVFYGYLSVLLLGLLIIGTAYLTWCPVLSGLGKNTTSSDSKLFFDVSRAIKFEENLGAISKRNRYIIGGVLLLLSVVLKYFILFPIALLVLASAVAGWCPFYGGIGRNTNKS